VISSTDRRKKAPCVTFDFCYDLLPPADALLTHLRQHAESTGHSKQHCIEAGLFDAVVLKQHATVGINIWPRVLDLCAWPF